MKKRSSAKVVHSKTRIQAFAAIVLSFVVLGAAAVLMYQNVNPRVLAQPSSQSSSSLSTQNVVDKVSQLITVDASIKPLVITIADVEKVRVTNPEFYKDAMNGDVVLVYPKEAIIYRESTNKIITVAPVTNGTSSPSSSQ